MRTILITGTSRGLGRAILDQLLHEDAFVIAIGRRFEPRHEEVARKGRLILVTQDLAEIKPEALSLADIIPENTRQLVFINNAATIEPVNKVGDLPEDASVNAVFVNYIAPLLLSNYLVRLAKHRNMSFNLLNISSGAARKPIPGWSVYCSTKSATEMFFRCLAEENENFVVEQIDPGVMETDMQRTIRAVPDERFPLRSSFATLHAEGCLRDPNVVAYEILKGTGLL